MTPRPPLVSLPPDARLLFRAPNWIGDTVMALPALVALRRAWPDAHIAVTTRRAALSVLERHPAASDLIELPSRRDRDREVVRRLAGEGYHATLLLSPSFRSAYQAWRARIPVRVGFAGQMRGTLLTHAVGQRWGRPAAHQVREYLDLAEALGGDPEEEPLPRMEPDARHVAVADRIREDIPAPLSRVVGIAPFPAGGPTKRWPLPHVRRLIGLLSQRGLLPVVFGGPGDGRRARRLLAPFEDLRRTPKALALAGRDTVPLLPLAVLARRIPVLVSVDTGPMHAWAAGGGRVVAIFGSSLPGLHGPLGEGHRVLHRGDLPCAGCYHRSCPHGLECLEGIPVEAVLEAVLDVVDDGT